jgi:hypothetical protein
LESVGKVKNFKVSLCSIQEIRGFVETWHYSKNVNGLISDYCFKLEDESGQLIGGMIYGRIAMAGVWKKYVDDESKLIELRRLCCIDKTPKNTESYFIGQTLKYLSKHTTIESVISYADQSHNHSGIIYQASNFMHLGITSKGKVIIFGDRVYHDKAIRTKYKGNLKPFAQRLKDALDTGVAYYSESKPKHIYMYYLNKKIRKLKPIC